MKKLITIVVFGALAFFLFVCYVHQQGAQTRLEMECEEATNELNNAIAPPAEPAGAIEQLRANKRALCGQ